jgi:ribosome maturation factor RimP
MDKDAIRQGIIERSGPIAESLGLELVSVEVSGSSKNLKVTVFIDRSDGLTLEDCASFSRGIGDAMDSDDIVPIGYTLEVSSPGLDRELKTSAEFRRFVGKLVKVRTKSPIDGQRNFLGRLVSVLDGGISVEDKTSGLTGIDFEQISKANLEIDLDEELKRA